MNENFESEYEATPYSHEHNVLEEDILWEEDDSKEVVRIKLASKNEAIPTRWLSQIVPQWDDGSKDYDVWR